METKKFILRTSDEVNSKCGTKAQGLAFLGDKVNVPQFVALDVDSFIRLISFLDICTVNEFFDNDFSDLQRCFENSYSKVQLDYPIEPEISYIVRSSAVPNILNDSFSSEISGAFESYTCVGTDIVRAILKVYQSCFTLKAYKQLKLFSQPVNFLGMGIIIQKYINAVYSGVIHVTGKNNIHIQWINGHLSKIVSGKEFGFSNLIYFNTKKEPIIRGTELEILIIKKNELYNILGTAANIAAKIYESIEKPCEIEWIYDGNTHWIVQCQELLK